MWATACVAPQIGGIERDRGAAGRLGGHVVTAFLVRKAAAGEDRTPSGQVAVPSRNNALDRRNHVPRPPQPEIFQVREPQRQRVGRMVGEDRFPGRQRTVEVAFNPGFQSLHMGLLARRRRGRQRPRGLRRLCGRRHTRLLVQQHGEIALETVRQAELRVGRKAARQMFPHIEAKLEKARKRALHRCARLGGRGRNRQAMKVLHRQPPERISPCRRRSSASARCLPFFVPVSYRVRAICGDIRGS